MGRTHLLADLVLVRAAITHTAANAPATAAALAAATAAAATAVAAPTPTPNFVRTYVPERTWMMPMTHPCPMRDAAVLRSILLVGCRCCCLC